MKKLFVVLAVVSIGFTACKKEWTCKCDNGVEGTTGTKVKKSEAQDWCDAVQSTQNILGGSVKCELE